MGKDLFMVSDFDGTMTPVVTHDGIFHADDVIALAIFSLANSHSTHVVRTRKEVQRLQATCVFDVGGKYDPEKGLFDHHQMKGGVTSVRFGFEGCASAGLAWDWFGPAVVVNHFSGLPGVLDGLDIDEIVREVHAAFIADIDAIDTGSRRPAPGEYSFSHAISSFNPVLNEDFDTAFLAAVNWVKPVIGDEINKAVAKIRDRQEALAAFEQAGQVAVFDRYLNGWQDIVPRISSVLYSRDLVAAGPSSVQRVALT